jgi:DNA-binding helix-hairpin-helix protein with protein kinase domain
MLLNHPFSTLKETEAAADAEGIDIAAGRVVPHDKVAAWLATWGTPDEQPLQIDSPDLFPHKPRLHAAGSPDGAENA